MPKNTSFGQQTQNTAAQDASVQQTVPAALLNLPGSIPASGSWTSDLITSDGYQKIAAGLTSSQNGSLSILRFLDEQGTIAQTAVTPVSVTGGTAAVINAVDGLPFATFQIKLTNTGGSAATVTNAAVLMQTQ